MRKIYFVASGTRLISRMYCIYAFFLLLIISKLNPSDASAQIWGPEGLNMPGAWNGWATPPTNNLALASSTQARNGTTNESGSQTVNVLPTAAISDNLSNIRIYPNPATNWVIVEAQVPFQIIVTDLTGKKVLSDQTSGTRLEIDFSNLPRGVYLIRLSTENTSEVRRIIKN